MTTPSPDSTAETLRAAKLRLGYSHESRSATRGRFYHRSIDSATKATTARPAGGPWTITDLRTGEITSSEQ